MKKLLASVLAGAMVLSLAACDPNSGGSVADEPIYNSTEKFEIGMWVGLSDKYVEYDEWGTEIPNSTHYLSEEEFMEKYQEIADSGVTVAYPGYIYMLWGTESYNQLCLKAASAAGIKQIISIPALREYFNTAKTKYDAGLLTKKEAVEKVQSLLKPYTEYEYAEALYGVMIKDEPNASQFDDLGFAQEIFHEAAPDLMFYTNLFPVIATGNALGGSTAIDYQTYIAQYLDKIKTDYISYDHYPLYKQRDYSLEKSFLQNMQIIRKAIDDEGEGRKMWTFLQSISYGSRNRALTCVGDASFQMYSFLAYGGDCVQWFCYACPPPSDGATRFGDDAPFDRSFEKTDAYTYIQTATQYVQAMMPWYKNFTWKGVMTSSEKGGEGNFELIEKLSGTDTLSKVEGTQDTLVGVFADKENGRDGYMVVNFTDPIRNKSNTVTLSVKGVHNAIVVKNGQKSIVPVQKGTVTLALEAGEGCFVIPY